MSTVAWCYEYLMSDILTLHGLLSVIVPFNYDGLSLKIILSESFNWHLMLCNQGVLSCQDVRVNRKVADFILISEIER